MRDPVRVTEKSHRPGATDRSDIGLWLQARVEELVAMNLIPVPSNPIEQGSRLLGANPEPSMNTDDTRRKDRFRLLASFTDRRIRF